MGDPISLAVAGASLASTGLSAYGSYQQGQSNAEAAQYKADSLMRAAQVGRIQADQTDAYYRDEIRTTLGNIDAIRASADADPYSPTAMAIKAQTETEGNRQRAIRSGSLRVQANQADMDAAFLRSTAGDYVTQGLIGGASSLFKGLGGINWGGFGGGGPVSIGGGQLGW